MFTVFQYSFTPVLRTYVDYPPGYLTPVVWVQCKIFFLDRHNYTFYGDYTFYSGIISTTEIESWPWPICSISTRHSSIPFIKPVSFMISATIAGLGILPTVGTDTDRCRALVPFNW